MVEEGDAPLISTRKFQVEGFSSFVDLHSTSSLFESLFIFFLFFSLLFLHFLVSNFSFSKVEVYEILKSSNQSKRFIHSNVCIRCDPNSPLEFFKVH